MKKKPEDKRKYAGTGKAPKRVNISSRERWKDLLPVACIVVISFLAYLPVFQNALLDWDDDVYIKNNPLIYSLNLGEIFSHNVQGNYHPFTILTLAIEYRLFGLNATGYHAVNLLLHLLNVVLVYYAVRLISNKQLVALTAALLFGIHPLHVESVAWASELKDLLYTLFFLASYVFYLKYLKEQGKKYYIYALLLFLASLLSKAMAASLPVVLLLTDYFKGRKFNKQTLLEKVPFFALAIIFGVVAIFAQNLSETIPGIATFTFPQRIVFASYGFMTYLFKLIFPLNLSAIYPYPVRAGESIPGLYYLSLVVIAALAAVIVYSHRFTKKIIFGMGFFTVTVFLVLQLLPVGNAMMADRYSYIPSIGIFYLAGEGLNRLWGTKFKVAAITVMCGFIIFFSIKTFAKCGVWKNDMTLWNNVISQYPAVESAYNSRGKVFAAEKKEAEAMNDFNKSIELNPDYFQAYYNRAILFMNQKKNGEALSDFDKTIELNPKYSLAYNNRGLLYMNENKSDDALRDFNKIIELDPNYFQAYNNRGLLLMNEKRNNEALNDFNKAIRLNPYFPMAYFNRGILYFNQRRYSESITDFSKAIALKNDYTEAYYNRGIAEYNSGKKDAACNDLRRAASSGYKPASDALGQICR